MSTIVTRAGKGSPLTHTEVDTNFTNLNTDKLQSGDTVASLTITSADINGGTIDGTAIGSSSASTGAFTSLTDSGNLIFTGTGNRITGDFSNATIANRVAFQNSGTNASTVIHAIPSGTGTTGGFEANNNSNITNSSALQVFAGASDLSLRASIRGTGTYLPLTMYTGGSERLRIDTSGNVGIGTSTPGSTLGIAWSSNKGIYLSDGTVTGIIYNTAGNSMSVGTTTNHPFAFYTNNTERMRIDTSGNLLVGGTSQTSYFGRIYSTTGTALNGIVVKDVANNGAIATWLNSSNAIAGTITISGTSTAYNTSSDYRLKENIQPMQNALGVVAQLNPVTYTWKADGSAGEGFIAHELQAIVPNAVTGEKDAVNEDGSIKAQGIDTSFLVATLTAAIQELKATVDAQAERIKALENK